jgi:hypothetical protein
MILKCLNVLIRKSSGEAMRERERRFLGEHV